MLTSTFPNTAYTPEVLPSAHRGTGNGLAVSANRVMGIISAVIATVSDVSNPPFPKSSLYENKWTKRG